MKFNLSTLGQMGLGHAKGGGREQAPNAIGGYRHCSRAGSGDRLLCIYLAQNSGVMRRYMDLS